MNYTFKHICIILTLHAAVSAYYITPLRAGTIQITDNGLRQEKNIKRMIDLSFTKVQFEAHKDTNVIASITSISMDENLNFHFLYDIICPVQQCMLNFTLVRYTETMNEDFTYSLTIDYLVARGMKVLDHNMTFFQEHINLKNVVSYDKDNNFQDLSKNLPYNNEDAWYLLLFPKGFNNLTLTGHIVYNYILGTDLYVVHYMDHTGTHGEHDSMGWEENQNYISYRAVLIPEFYLNIEGCTPDQKFTLTQHYEHTCSGGGDVSWFVGFEGTKEKEIQGEMFTLQSGFSYSLARPPAHYGLMAFPFMVDENFADNRVHEYKWEVEYRKIGTVAGYIIAVGLIGGIILAISMMIRRCFKRSKGVKKVGKYDKMQEQVIPSTQQQCYK